MTTVNNNTFKFDSITKERIRALAKKVYATGGGAPALALACIESGIKGPTGDRLKTNQVYYYINEAKERVHQSFVTKRCPSTIAGILTDPSLSEGQKVKMLAAYYEL